MDYVFVLGGLVALFLGGEALVRGAVGIAARLGMSSFLIGLTVVGFGTSMPELLVSVDAAWRGVPDIAVGNIVGSNIANILLILGCAALLRPVAITGDTLRRDTGVMVLAVLALVPLFAMGEIGRGAGLVLFAALLGYLVWTARQSSGVEADEEDLPQMSIGVALIWALAGLIALAFGARFLVDGAVSIARGFGVSEAFIGLTIVAVGTSLPELATAVVAALRRQSDIVIGNVIGSNIFNVLGILGLTAMITPVPVASRFLAFDLPVVIGLSLALAALLLTRPMMGRWVGVAMLLGYAAYVVLAQAGGG